MTIGWFGGDLVDAVADVVTSAFDRLPGSEALSHAVSDVWTGPLRDFAKTPLGVTVLTAVASAAYGPLAYALGGPYGLANFGAQLATVTWALPGLARGENFYDAWIAEVKRRAEKTAEVVGGEAAASVVANIGVATDFLKGLAPEQLQAISDLPEELVAETVRTLAAEAGVDDWSIAMALDGLVDTFPGPPSWGGLFEFDEVTGAMLRSKTAATTDVRGWYGDLAAQFYGTREPAHLEVPLFDPAAVYGSSSAPRSSDVAPLVQAAIGAAPPSPRKRAGDIALGFVIVAAAGTFWWWRKQS